MQLTKPRILDAALSILRDYGLADMTMRRIAKQLSVAPGALYWHYPNKQALLAGIAEALLEPFFDDEAATPHPDAEALPTTPVTSPPPVTGESAALNRCCALRQCLLAVNDGAEVVAAALVSPTLRDKVLEAMNSEGSNDLLGLTLMHFVIGFVLDEQTRQQSVALGVEVDYPDEQARKAAADTALHEQQFRNCVQLILRGTQ